MNEFIPQDLEPVQLDKLGRELANEVARLGKIVAGYEVEVAAKTKAYKLEMAKAKILCMDTKLSATILNAMAETFDVVILASNELQQAEANLIIGKAELSGREAQYQVIKKIMDLKIQELKTLR